eukprot:1435962-Prymnesium_polylepis.1
MSRKAYQVSPFATLLEGMVPWMIFVKMPAQVLHGWVGRRSQMARTAADGSTQSTGHTHGFSASKLTRGCLASFE